MSSSSSSRQLPLRIAFTGIAHSGKDTAADYLVRHHGYTKMGFAPPVKEVAELVLGINPEQITDKEAVIPELGVSARQVWQVIGTELFRDRLIECLPALRTHLAGGSTWINIMAQKIAALPTDAPIVVFDQRFGNEYEWLRANGFIVVLVVRPAQRVISQSSHSSEAGSPYDITMLNVEGDRSRLYHQIEQLGNTQWRDREIESAQTEQIYHVLANDSRPHVRRLVNTRMLRTASWEYNDHSSSTAPDNTGAHAT